MTVALPDLYGVDNRVKALLDAVSDGSIAGLLRRRRTVPDILARLWDAVVAPVVHVLPSSESPLRVW